MRYASARFKKEAEEEAYRVYVADVGRGLLKSMGGDMTQRYYDMIHPKPVDPRSGDMIAADVIKRLTGEEVWFEST